jgi:hypothetical protein
MYLSFAPLATHLCLIFTSSQFSFSFSFCVSNCFANFFVFPKRQEKKLSGRRCRR